MADAGTYSPLIRTACGILGVLGFSAIGFEVVQEGHFQFSLIVLAKFLAGFVFLYVAIFGSNPLNFGAPKDNGS